MPRRTVKTVSVIGAGDTGVAGAVVVPPAS